MEPKYLHKYLIKYSATIDFVGVKRLVMLIAYFDNWGIVEIILSFVNFANLGFKTIALGVRVKIDFIKEIIEILASID